MIGSRNRAALTVQMSFVAAIIRRSKSSDCIIWGTLELIVNARHHQSLKEMKRALIRE